METLTVYYAIISTSLVMIVVIFAVIAFYAIRVLKTLDAVLTRTNSIVSDVRQLQGSVELGILTNIVKVLRVFTKRG